MVRIAQFTDDHRAALLRLYNEGYTHARLADKVRCSQTTIQRVLNSTPGYKPRPGRGGAQKTPGITARTVALRARARELRADMEAADVARVMGLTKQRVHQLLNDKREPVTRG